MLHHSRPSQADKKDKLAQSSWFAMKTFPIHVSKSGKIVSYPKEFPLLKTELFLYGLICNGSKVRQDGSDGGEVPSFFVKTGLKWRELTWLRPVQEWMLYMSAWKVLNDLTIRWTASWWFRISLVLKKPSWRRLETRRKRLYWGRKNTVHAGNVRNGK